MIVLGIISIAIGLALGLLGGGGSILAVPVLTYGAGLSAKEAIATSLLVVGTTAIFALIPHARRGHVAWGTGAVFAAAAMVGAFGGGLMAAWFDGTTLLLLFAAMMVVTAIAMSRPKSSGDTDAPKKAPAFGLAVIEGLVVGAATGLVGAGGGFLVVPALVLLGGMPMHRAIGTSLMVIALKSFAAFAGHAAHVTIDIQTVVVVTAAAVVGSLIGGTLATRLPANALRSAFAALVVVMAGYVVWREANPLAASVVVIVTAVFILFLRRSSKSPRR